MKKRHVDTATKEGYGVNNIVIFQFCTKLHCASQEQCHVCLGSHLTKLCLPCVVTSKMLLSMLGGSTLFELQDTPGSTSCSVGTGRPSF